MKKYHLKGRHIQHPFKYCSTEVFPPPSKKRTWQLAPQRGVVINADCSDSQWKTEGAETVWKISAGTGHLHKGMLLRGVLRPKGAIYLKKWRSERATLLFLQDPLETQPL